MKKQTKPAHPVAAYVDDVFSILSKTTLPIGKLTTVLVAKKDWVDAYNEYYEDTHGKELAMQAILEKMRIHQEDEDKAIFDAYKSEYSEIAKTVKPAPQPPNKLYPIRMSVVKFDKDIQRYIVEPTKQTEINKLNKYGYV